MDSNHQKKDGNVANDDSVEAGRQDDAAVAVVTASDDNNGGDVDRKVVSFMDAKQQQQQQNDMDDDDDDDHSNDHDDEDDDHFDDASHQQQHRREEGPQSTNQQQQQQRPTLLGNKSKTLLRSERRLNVDTGAYVNRECRVEVVTGLTEPMDPAERRRKEFFSKSKKNVMANSNSNFGQTSPGTAVVMERQYRLNTRSSNSSRDQDSNQFSSMDFFKGRVSTRALNSYVYWTFQTSFWNVFLSLSVLFLLFVTLWACLIYAIAQFRPQCLYVGSLHFDEAGNYFIDAFAVSWTTFSTVGYGLTGPNTSNEKSIDHCIGTNMIASVEALFGVLFGGFAGAIIFGKVTRVQSVARVMWSSPVVVRYGRGVDVRAPKPTRIVAPGIEPNMSADDSHIHSARSHNTNTSNDDDDSSSSDDEEKIESHLPCPVLEFRVINQLYDQVGGEIINSGITVWASTVAETSAPSILAAATKRHQHKHIPNPLSHVTKNTTNVATKATKKVAKVAKRMSAFAIGSNKASTPSSASATASVSSSIRSDGDVSDTNDFQAAVAAAVEADRRNLMSQAQSMMESKKHVVMQEDPTSKVTPQLIYSKLDIETDSHPFFKRVWIVRHVLNAESPLLSVEAQEAIRSHGGFWPKEWNNYRDVRRHIKYNEIMVSFSGTANVSGNTVYSQKVYDFVDMNVGWRFADTLVRDPDTKSISVDITLINDVLEQHGGGGEPFTDLTNAYGDHDAYESSMAKQPVMRIDESEEDADVDIENQKMD